MNHLPPSIVKTWVFLAQSTEPNLAQAKFLACKKITSYYGSIELAKIYLEQQTDKDIEVVVV